MPRLPYWPVVDRLPFELALQRVRRAAAHHKTGGDLWNAFLDDEPYSSSVYVDDGGLGEISVLINLERLPLSIGLELGEML